MLITSNIINRLYNKLPLPFIQIILGILVGIMAKGESLTLNSELFLALVIAPLNFREGQLILEKAKKVILPPLSNTNPSLLT